jgi:aspartyl-tRNA(Asn)/glutamyl-tRNA(Gln) amidotransferase subunit B
VRYLEICDGNMEEGSLRCDVNLSIRPVGSETLGTKTEVKNLNSFKQVEQAIEFEFQRQSKVLESGGRVAQDTLLWDAAKGQASVMRSKEEAHDYRYFPEPDLRVLQVSAATISRVRGALPELPSARESRFVSQYKLPAYDANLLTSARDVAQYYEDVVSAGADPKAASNWVMGEVMREMNETAMTIAEFKIPPKNLAELAALQSSGKINSTTAKDVFKQMLETGASAATIVAKGGLEQVSDTSAIEADARVVLDENPDEVARYLGGKEQLLQFFVGQLMKRTKGKANPKMATDAVKEMLEALRAGK